MVRNLVLPDETWDVVYYNLRDKPRTWLIDALQEGHAQTSGKRRLPYNPRALTTDTLVDLVYAQAFKTRTASEDMGRVFVDPEGWFAVSTRPEVN
jgi:hypothetical protein